MNIFIFRAVIKISLVPNDIFFSFLSIFLSPTIINFIYSIFKERQSKISDSFLELLFFCLFFSISAL